MWGTGLYRMGIYAQEGPGRYVLDGASNGLLDSGMYSSTLHSTADGNLHGLGVVE